MIEKYSYHSIPVPGGGFVTGFVFHPVDKNLLYCRTDIGGVYRYDFDHNRWQSLVDQIMDTQKWKTYPISIALDPKHANRLYMAVGEHEESAIGYSEDFGDTFEYIQPPIVDGKKVMMHGNAPGRSTGERLVVDPYDSNLLYLGTMEDGLWRSKDRCKTWEKVQISMPDGIDEKNIAFVEFGQKHGAIKGHAKCLLVASNGQGSARADNVRGQSVFVSFDGGESFNPLQGEPEPVTEGQSDYPGYVAQRAVFDDKYLYVTYAAYNIGWSSWHTYGCDTGKCYDGALYRFEFDEDGQVIESLDLTPDHPILGAFKDAEAPKRRLGYGMSGITADVNQPGVLLCTTITCVPDVVYRSVDYGKKWTPIMSGLEIGEIDFEVPYLKPENNGNDSLIHWMSDIKIDPFNGDMALFNTGAGVFMTNNLTDSDRGDTVKFKTCNDGIEETVHLNVYAPSKGDVKVIDIIGDYGGFVFSDLDQPAKNTFADSDSNRWITCMNADFPDSNPYKIVATGRGNWTGLTKGGLIMTNDQGEHWEKLPYPGPIDPVVDVAIERLKRPNVTSGWVAISADGKVLVWSIGQPLDGNRVISRIDGGTQWQKTIFYDLQGEKQMFDGQPVKVFSDRMVATRFFAFADFNEGPRFYVSADCGLSFKEVKGPNEFPNKLLAGIDSEQDIEIRGIPSQCGQFLLAMEEEGLWQLNFNEAKGLFGGEKLSEEGDYIKRIGIGKAAEGALCDTLFTSGTIKGVYGFFRSTDWGKEWSKVNDQDNNFGDIRSISGDPRVFGQFYIATGTRGLLYGKPLE